MGYYFEKAKTTAELNPEQLARYKELRSGDQTYPPALQDRVVVIRNYIGPITSGEIWAAYEELAQDTVVNWVLAGEDPSKVQWSDPQSLIVIPPPPTPEEKEAARLRSEAYFREQEERERERKRRHREDYENAKRDYEQHRTFFEWIRDRFSPLYPPYEEIYPFYGES